MTIEDAITICLVVLALWTFIPRSFRAALRGGLEPTVIAVAEVVRRGTRTAARVIADLAYTVLIGQPRVNNFDAPKADYVAPIQPQTAAAPPEPAAVLAGTHQPGSIELPKNNDMPDPPQVVINARLSKAELITLLAVQKKDDGAYLYSSNQITAFVGGTAADVKRLIAEIREPVKPVEETPPQGRGKSLRKPAEGW